MDEEALAGRTEVFEVEDESELTDADDEEEEEVESDISRWISFGEADGVSVMAEAREVVL